MFMYNIVIVALFSLGEGRSLRPRSSRMIRASKWSIGTETMDRNLTIYNNYERFLEPLGAKRARLQGGWHRCDPNGTAAVTGEYNWEWLDQAVFGIHAKGIKPWIELSYGNAAYPGGGGNGPGAWIPNTSVALAAFSAWTEALVARYSNVTDEFEIWNEPRLSWSNYEPYARLAATACVAAHKGANAARSRVGPPQLFFGVMSGGYTSSGVAFLNGTLPLLDRMLREGSSGLELKDCVAAVTYHAYTNGPPEETHSRRLNYNCGAAPTPCSAVEALHATLKTFVPSAYVFQGEAGAPARRSRGGAMEPRNWTEVQQMKWNLRSLIGDAAHPIVRYSSLFTLMDVCYHAAAHNIGWYGLLASSCAPKVPGSNVADNKTVDHVRLAYRAAQSIYTLFDDDVVPVLDAVLRFQCERNATNAGTDICRLDGDNASSPRPGMHCDLNIGEYVGHFPASNEMDSAEACRQRCCGVKLCNCWAWSTLPRNSGCWLKHYPNASIPLVPAEKGLTGGKVKHSNATTPFFNPTGYAFRNRTTASTGITHVVVWDATPLLHDADRTTRCNVSVDIVSSDKTTTNSNASRSNEVEDVLEQQHQHRQRMKGRVRQKGSNTNDSIHSRSDAAGAVLVVLGNGSIRASTVQFPESPSETIRFPVELFDAPILFARNDALPITQPSTCTMTRWNQSGCVAAGHYAKLTDLHSADECCAACAANVTGCNGWSFVPHTNICYLASNPQRRPDVNATCGCRNPDCRKPPVPCKPIYRPPAPQLIPLPSGIARRPNFISIIADDLGWADTSLHNPDISFTPTISELRDEGILLTRHHTYFWCSPTRRAFLSGRYPAHISGKQAPLQSNYLPLQFSNLAEKLAAADYESHFVGKGHLGYHTTDHLPVNRGFDTHLGYLEGAESYDHGCRYGHNGIKCCKGDECGFRDMWHDRAPANETMLDGDLYSTNFYTRWAVERIKNRNQSRPFWLHLAFQAVHAPFVPPLPWELLPKNTTFRSRTYGSMIKVMDDGLRNITTALKAQPGAWNNTLLVFFSDNGGDCGLSSRTIKGEIGMSNNYPLLGRKCTAWEGGTRVSAFVSGGLIPHAQRATSNSELMYVTDWFPTFSHLAGVNSSDDWMDGEGVKHGIDGVDLWPTLRDGSATTQLQRQWLPTSERSILHTDGKGHMWKLINSGNAWLQPGTPYGAGEYKGNRFTPNGTQFMDTHNPCLPHHRLHHHQHHQNAPNGSAYAITAVNPHEGSFPPPCVVCTNSTPCVFDVISDPLETNNLFGDPALPPGLVENMSAKLASFAVYSPMTMTAAELGCYNCSLTWGTFMGPRCAR